MIMIILCVVYQGKWTKMDVCDQDSPTTAIVRLHNFGFEHFLSHAEFTLGLYLSSTNADIK